MVRFVFYLKKVATSMLATHIDSWRGGNLVHPGSSSPPYFTKRCEDERQ